jgi:uncharacterized protein YndB with AHSA1/START domain
MSDAATATATKPARPAAPQQPQAVQTLEIRKESVIDAPVEIVWESILEELGPVGIPGEAGKSMPMKLEAWPGGRWFRDLGAGTGHLWGHVQVIKPPKLLEIAGPLFMSYPATNHLQYRLADEPGAKTRLTFAHRAIGLIAPDHASGVQQGWNEILERIRKTAARRAGR